MIQSLDDTLFHLLANGLTTLGSATPTAAQIRFQPPDTDWRAHVTTLGAMKAVNLYLVDLRENRQLRASEAIREFDPVSGTIHEWPAPTRVDCHYLITAWSNASEDLADPEHGVHGETGEEHMILHEVASLLNENQPLVPANVYGGSFPPFFDSDLAVATLPTLLLPVEGFYKYAEFWGTMGDLHPWKPAVYYVVTVPLRVPQRTAGPPVTTLIDDFRSDWTQPGDVLIDIGGTVLDPTSAPVSGAWVRLSTPTGDLQLDATSDTQGHFVFSRITSQQYQLMASASGFGQVTRSVLVPSPTGEYDLQLT